MSDLERMTEDRDLLVGVYHRHLETPLEDKTIQHGRESRALFRAIDRLNEEIWKFDH